MQGVLDQSAEDLPAKKLDRLISPDAGYGVLRDCAAVEGLIESVRERLVTLGLTDRPAPLDELHRHLPPEAMALNEHYTNAVSRAFYTPDAGIQAAYASLVVHLARDIFDFDFLFQAQPIVRFHFPVAFPTAMRTPDGRPRQLHSDLLGGHPAAMIQGWAALTDCAGSAALQIASRADGADLLSAYRESLRPEDPPFADSLRHFYHCWDTQPGFAEHLTAMCRPLPMAAGDVLIFDPHCIHGGTENTSDTTRVSVDFRLLPVEFEETVMRSAETPTARRFRRGDLFDERSAKEVAGGSK